MKTGLTLIAIFLFTALPCFAQLTTDNLIIDTKITGFQFATDYQGTVVYTANGKADLDKVNPSAFSYTLINGLTYDQVMKELSQYLSMSIQNGYVQSDFVKKETVINGYKVYYISLTETMPGTDYKNFAFDGFYFKDNQGVLFISGDLDGGKYTEGFKKTFFATVIK